MSEHHRRRILELEQERNTERQRAETAERHVNDATKAFFDIKSERDALAAQLAAAEASNAQLRQTMERLEWLRVVEQQGNTATARWWCAACGAEQGNGHKPDCVLSAILASPPAAAAALLARLEQLERVKEAAEEWRKCSGVFAEAAASRALLDALDALEQPAEAGTGDGE